MSLIAMLSAALDGKLFSVVAQSLDLDEAETQTAMLALCPAIAIQLKTKAASDDDLFESLLDLIEDGNEGSPFDDPEAMTGPEALSDGNAILNDIYGSRNDAMVALRSIAPQVPERELAKLAPISATAVVAALAHANQSKAGDGGSPAPLPLTGVQTAAGGNEGGILGTIIGAVISGVVSGAARELNAKRRRSAASYKRSRSRTTRTKSKTASQKRRTTSASIEDIFRDILGGLRK